MNYSLCRLVILFEVYQIGECFVGSQSTRWVFSHMDYGWIVSINWEFCGFCVVGWLELTDPWSTSVLRSNLVMNANKSVNKFWDWSTLLMCTLHARQNAWLITLVLYNGDGTIYFGLFSHPSFSLDTCMILACLWRVLLSNIVYTLIP